MSTIADPLRVLDLFSGIGGFSLGLERTGGFKTVAFCEIEEYPRQVLAKHWPGVPIYHDVRELTADTLSRDGIAVDVICGGFPCQDISFAGAGAGIEGARSGLWGEYARLIGELRPCFVIVENVAALLSRGLGRVLGDLAALGYDAEWDCIPASAVGAPHRRDRVWIIAYADVAGSQGRVGEVVRECAGQWTARPSSPSMADTKRLGQQASWDIGLYGSSIETRKADRLGSGCEVLAYAASVTSNVERKGGTTRPRQAGGRGSECGGWWLVEPDVGRVAHGVPARVDRLKGLGNAVVPQIPELIGRAIMASFTPLSHARDI